MNIRDAMKSPQDPGGKGQGADSLMAQAMQESLAGQEQFDKTYLDVLAIAKQNWAAAGLGRSPDFNNTTKAAQAIQNILQENKEVGNLFRRVQDTPDYFLNSVNVAWMAVTVGIELHYEKSALLELGVAALWHDIGLCKVPEEILLKKEKLSFDEYELIRQHPEEGRKIAAAIPGVGENIPLAIYQEHERENGSGYPEGLRGNQIHEYAKIIGLCDVFEAMTHFRAYRRMVTPYEAILQLVEMKNRTFPDKLIKVFINRFTFYPVGSFLQLNSGEIGCVTKVHRNFPTRPTLEVVVDREGKKPGKPFWLKLTAENLLYVKETLTEEKLKESLGEKKG